jgi:MFS family permease
LCDDDRSRPLRRLAVPVYAPAAIYSIGLGAVSPVVAVAAHQMGASLWVAGLIAGLPTVGHLLADVPAGVMVARLGERTSMILAAIVTLSCAGGVILAGNLTALAIASLLQGVSSATFELARHALITHLVPPWYRGRALGTLAGMARLGITVGPFLTVGLIAQFGVVVAYWAQIAACVAVITFLIIVADPVTGGDGGPARADGGDDGGGTPDPRGVFRSNAVMFARLGSGVGALMMLRMSRQIIVPLWGIEIGLDPSQIVLAVGLSGLLELVLFYTGGQIADRFGRIWVAVPVVAALSVGHIALVAAHDATSFYVVTLMLGLANAFSGGIMMILGSDLAPVQKTSEFLGAWRLFADAGGALAPAIISVGTALAPLAVVPVSLGVLGLMGSLTLYRYLPVYLGDSRA